jgi:hypothetical protein
METGRLPPALSFLESFPMGGDKVRTKAWEEKRRIRKDE